MLSPTEINIFVIGSIDVDFQGIGENVRLLVCGVLLVRYEMKREAQDPQRACHQL